MHTQTHACTIQAIQTQGCDKVSRQRYLASGSRVLRGMAGEKYCHQLCPCVCVRARVCVLNLCPFLASVRDSGLRTITDITHDSPVTTQGHYIQNADLMISGCTVEGVSIAG